MCCPATRRRSRKARGPEDEVDTQARPQAFVLLQSAGEQDRALHLSALPIIAQMPKVFVTGFMIVLMEWTCTQLLSDHLEPGEGSLGTHVDVSHLAATPPGMTVKVDVEVSAVQGRKIVFKVSAHDGMDLIGEGRHERVAVSWDRFNTKVAEKAKAAARNW